MPAATDAMSANSAEVEAIVTADADDVRPSDAVKARLAEIHNNVNVPAIRPRLRPRDMSTVTKEEPLLPTVPPTDDTETPPCLAATSPPYSTNEHAQDLENRGVAGVR